jgi:co-chaperonin GroES (HSP10)
MKIRALKGKVLVTDLERGDRVINGIIIPDDNGKSSGIRSRWGKVYAVGNDIKDIKVGEWILIEHARWTRMIKIKDEKFNDIQLWGVDWPKSVLLVSDTDPEATSFSPWV